MTRRTGLWIIALPVSIVLLLAVPFVLRLRADGAEGMRPYRYRFERAARGSITRALESEIAFYQGRIHRDPDGGLDLASLGRAYLKMARATGDLSWYLLAEQAARRSLGNLPFHNDAAVLVLAKVAEARHDFDEAIRLATRAGGTNDALTIFVSTHLAIGRVDEAARAAEALVERSPGLVSLALRGLAKVAQGEDGEAIENFTRAIASEESGEAGSSAWARTLLGRLNAKRGRLNLARDLYQEALRILPQYPLALLNLAELEARAGEYADAERHHSQVVTISAASPNVYDHAVLRGLARVKDLQGDHAGAGTLWDQAEGRLRRDVAEGSFGHRRELARLLLERGRTGDLAEALALMHTEVSTRPDPETLDILAWALSRADRWAEARQAMREALRWGLRDAAMFYRAGTIAQTLGDQDEARRYFQLSRETDPTFDEQARRVLGIGF